MSVEKRIVEHVFDYMLLPAAGRLAGLSDAELIDTMAGWAKFSAAADAHRLATIAEFTSRRLAAAECPDWVVDDYAAASIEVAAALNVSNHQACRQMDLGMALRTRFPKIAARYAAGETDSRTVTTIQRRTGNVTDQEALAALDEALVAQLDAYGPLSQRKLESAVDLWVTAVDPEAVIRSRSSARNREIGFGDDSDADGITTIWGRLLAPDAKLLDERLTTMAIGVCTDDPRTRAQRRADALGALAAGKLHLACACGAPTCPTDPDDGRAGSVVVHVLADPHSLTATCDPYCHGVDRAAPDEPARPPLFTRGAVITIGRKPEFASSATDSEARTTTQPEATSTPQPTGAPESGTEPEPPKRVLRPQLRPAAIVGGPILPAALLAELIKRGARVRYLSTPSTEPQPGYRPSTALDQWVRMRDLTCRAPGCDKPAVAADIDHTAAWPIGPTHPSNNKCYCRFHHLAKTFWAGFTDRQYPDGTVEFTTPTGHTYRTHAFSQILFPAADITTAALLPSLPPGREPDPDSNRALKMPKRKRTRGQERRYRVDAERARNREQRVLDGEDLPPPF